MKNLRDYIAESEQWVDNPVAGDDFAINIREECLLESHIVDVTEDAVVIEADDRMLEMLESYGLLGEEELAERIARYGPASSNMSQGYSMTEQDMAPHDHRAEQHAQSSMQDEDALEETNANLKISRILELAGLPVVEDEPIAPPQNANANDPLLGKAVDDAAVQPMEEGVMSDIDMDLRHIAKTQRIDALVDALRGEFGPKTAQYLHDLMDEVDQDLEQRGMATADMKKRLAMLMNLVQEIYHDQDLAEAEYRGRKVPLGKPMAGDVKKKKVYVRKPNGNVVKVEFGDKTMRIKKSNPKRRKSFRARHNCENPGPRWKARYWSCRAW